jgi:rubrerythrin
MDDRERLNALEVALANEMKEREFYLKNAERTRNPLGKAMFKQIGDDELEHYERLKELHKTWEAKDKWPETIPLKVSETNIKKTLGKVLEKIDKTTVADADDLAAVKIAVDFEEKGVQFYARLRDSSTDPREKSFFDLLSMIENEHYLSLRNAEEYFTDPTGWFLKMEHHTFDGG